MKFYELNAARPCRCRIERTKKDVIPVQDFSRCAICFHQVHSPGHPEREPRPYLCESSLGLEKSWYQTKLVRVYTYVDHVPFCTAQYWRDESCHSETLLPFETFADYHYVQLLLRCVWVLWLFNFSNLPRARPQSFAFADRANCCKTLFRTTSK